MARIAQNAASVQLVAAANRTGLLIHNDASAELRIRFGSGAATLIDYAVAIPPGELYEFPFGVNAADTEVRGIWASAGAGAAQVTEV